MKNSSVRVFKNLFGQKVLELSEDGEKVKVVLSEEEVQKLIKTLGEK